MKKIEYELFIDYFSISTV